MDFTLLFLQNLISFEYLFSIELEISTPNVTSTMSPDSTTCVCPTPYTEIYTDPEINSASQGNGIYCICDNKSMLLLPLC